VYSPDALGALGRSCESCHNEPVALGYGRGLLRDERSAAGGRWTFQPDAPFLTEDGMTADAWIRTLGARAGTVSTRDEVRPFDVEEQREILRVGGCPTCHDAASRAMRDSLRDFGAFLARRSSRRVTPVWE
jgi:hypothetical protein